VSLFLKSDSSKYLSEVSSRTGDMYEVVGHHGPAVENEYYALRFFFNHSTSIDVYSKKNKGLELKKYRWYPTPSQQAEGAGCDMYKVGSTVGLGGVWLWDGEKVIEPDPVTIRIAKVVKKDSSTYMEMISKGVPYKGRHVDIRVRVTLFSGRREARVEGEEMNGEKVQFVTGINYHKNNKMVRGKSFIAVWGKHPEDVSTSPADIGAAIFFNPDDVAETKDDGTQVLLIYLPASKLRTFITSASSKEPVLNKYEYFLKYIDDVNFLDHNLIYRWN